jgi:predicted ATPase/DNA-binding CsgD family transcriptional regulator
VRRLLAAAEHAVVTLVGVGGCGKTSLVRAAVETCDEVIWADLGTLGDPELVPAVIATAAGIAPEPGRALLEVLRQELVARPSVLVLDGCERILGAVRAFVASVTDTGCGLRILATSQVLLDVPSEVGHAVEPLEVPEPTPAPPAALLDVASVRLFVARARDADPAFALTAATAPSVVRLCRRVEGLPLAIELLAARLGTMPVEELLGLLDTDHAPGSVTWAYELLGADEQRLLRRLSVFAGGWTLDLATAVCVDEHLTPAAFTRAHDALRRRSLVRAVPGSDERYRLLEPVRDEARRQLRDDDAPTARRRLTTACLALVRAGLPERAWSAPPDPAVLDALAGEHANLVAAIGYAERVGDRAVALELTTRLWTYWRVRGHLTVGRLLTDRLLASVDEDDSPVQTEARLAAASYAQSAGQLDEAERHLGAALARCRRLADEVGYGTALAVLANVASARGDHERAVDLYLRAAHESERLGRGYGLALVLTNLALAHLELGRRAEARAALERADGLLADAGDVWFRAYTLTCLGRVARDGGDLLHEHDAALRGAELLSRHGGGPELAEAVEHLADLESALGNTSLGVRLYAAAEEVRTRSGVRSAPGHETAVSSRIGELRALLGADAFGRHWAGGQGAPVDVTLAEARAAVHRTPQRRGHTRAPSWPLTARELEVVQAVATGLTNREIGERLHISPATVKTHVEHALAKLGFERRTELAAWVERRRPRRPHSARHTEATPTVHTD